MYHSTAKSPLFRKCDKILITAAAVIGLSVVAGSAFAGSPKAGELPVLAQSHVSDAEKRGFNPQPEPPKLRIFGNGAGAVMFNPQPEPPANGMVFSR